MKLDVRLELRLASQKRTTIPVVPCGQMEGAKRQGRNALAQIEGRREVEVSRSNC